MRAGIFVTAGLAASALWVNMQRESDQQLLQAYGRDGDESAFAALVARYTDVVYSSARRQLGDPHLAEDVTQRVFIVLARKAASLRSDCILSAWLLKAVRYIVADTIKAEARRRRRETRAAHMASSMQDGVKDQGMSEIEPIIDQALARLPWRYRSALLLRFFEQREYGEVARRLEISEDAARQRISRGLEKLRELLVGKGAVVTSVALSSWLASNAVKAGPAGLSASSIAAAKTASTLALSKGAVFTMATLQTKLIAAGILLLLGLSTVAAVVAHEKAKQTNRPVLLALADAPAPSNPQDAEYDLASMVKTADGKPVANAQVLLAEKDHHIVVYGDRLPSGVPLMQGNGIATPIGAYRDANTIRTTSGADGRFTIHASSPNPHIVVRCDEGFAQLMAKDLLESKSITIEPWASVEGTFKLDGQGVKSQPIQLFRMSWMNDATNIAVIHVAETTTDAQGHFSFPRIAPGPVYIAHYIRPWTTLHTHWQFHIIKPGEQKQIQLGDTGAAIVGTLAAPADWPETVLWKPNNRTDACFAYVWDKRGLPRQFEPEKPATMGSSQSMTPRSNLPIQADRPLTPRQVEDYREHALPWWVPIDPDGAFGAVGLPPGDYRMTVKYYHADDAAMPMMDTLMEADRDFTVAADDARKKTTLNLGPVTLGSTGQLRIGDEAPEITGEIGDGKEWKLSDQRGKYVLLCFESAPFVDPGWDSTEALKEIARAWGDDPRFVMMGVSMDDSPETMRLAVEKKHLIWPHIFMGNKANAYHVTSPKTFLIDAKGKIIARGMVGKNNVAAVEKALGK
jgi:RNA polymerase sigma factor (sigma-70 family)